MKKNNGYKIDKYEASHSYDDYNSSIELIEKAEEADIPIEKDASTLKNQLNTDIRDNVPPQIYSVVSGIIGLITKLEEVDKDEG